MRENFDTTERSTHLSVSGSAAGDISILVVDDNSVDRLMITTACEGLNAEIEMASNGEEALRMFKDRRHQLVITDYMMEPLNGLNLAKELRAIEPEVGLIFVSGAPSSELLEYVKRHELPPVIIKPITLSALFNSAALSIERKRGRRELLSGVALTNRLDTCLPLLGNSAQCQSLRKEVVELLRSADPLLISGDKGSGKAEVAHFLHREGTYGNGICLDFDCAVAGAEELSRKLISEDGEFGEMLSMAGHITLIIHTVEAMPMPQQKAFAKAFDPIIAKLDLVVLTDVCLDTLFNESLMDASLYFKLSLMTLSIPSLTRRTEDLADMVRFICDARERYGLVKTPALADAYIQSDSFRDSFSDLNELIESIREYSQR